MEKRIISTLGIALVLIILLASVAHAGAELKLITISYQGAGQLERLASWGLRIINYRGDILAALADDEQIRVLRRAGFQVSVLDPSADAELYYLAYPPAARTRSAMSGVQAAYPYAEGVYIIKATPEQARALPVRGVEIVKLPKFVVLPRSQPANSWQVQLAHSPAIQAMAGAVSPDRLMTHACKLQDDGGQAYCNEWGTRYSYATAKINEAAQYLYDQYAALGLQVTYDSFTGYGTPMINIVAELPGVGPGAKRIYILCAHYDSISRDSDPFHVAPGADDNASGSAAVLEAARILSQYRFSHTLRFIHFAGEEQGLLGSADYAERAYMRGDLIDSVINLDMIAYEAVDRGHHVVEIHAGTGPASIALADALIDNVSEYGVLLAPQRITDGATDRSDHASFWNYGYPAILGIEDFQEFSPYYHSKDDTVAHMKPQMMVEFTKVALVTAAELAALLGPRTPTATPTRTSTPVARLHLPIILRP